MMEGENAMGLTFVWMDVGNPAKPEVTESLQFLVDSGAAYSVVPTPVLERLGIKPFTEQEFRLANGTRMTRKRGAAIFKYQDRLGAADVIFGEEGDYLLMGVLTLESLGFALDPLKRELRPIPMLLFGVGIPAA